MNSENDGKVRLIASAKNWMDGNAVAQLKGTAGLPGIELAVGLPDLHPGKSGPVGASFVAEGLLYPHLIGNDIGCGMGLWRSDLKRRKTKLDRWEKKLTDLDQPWPGDRSEWLAGFGLKAGAQDHALGTVGGGNHFAELQQVEAVQDQERFRRAGLDTDSLIVLVHSGSRSLGQAILAGHTVRHGYSGLGADSSEGQEYLARHDQAVAWAQANRALIAYRFLQALGSKATKVLDLPHNFVEPQVHAGRPCWIHRKGSNPGNRGPLVVAGSRGALSYLVEPCGEQLISACSLAHGAGRKWNRTDCRARLRERYNEAALQRTELGGRVICEDRDLLYEEAPQVYKKIEVVVQDLVDAGLVRILATLRPLITYKVRRAAR